ncbi:MAG: type I glutamate--ammonia ligase [Candidatus Krumholzibacteria bacterium]|nr:type I glutamate--ammonia ligase [Candidatus Krumholzibacteria bacterium]
MKGFFICSDDWIKGGLDIFSSITKLRTEIKKHDIRLIDLKFTDFLGKWHHMTVPTSNLDKKMVTNGLGFDGSNFAGLKTLELGDLSLVPDLSTGFIDPFSEIPTVSFICDIVEADSKKPFPRDPRFIAQKAADHMRKTGIADLSLWGPEFEYYIFDKVLVSMSHMNFGYEIHPCEGEDAGKFGLKTSGGYHALPPEDAVAGVRDRTVVLLEEAGIPIHYHHHEVGGHGQVEIEVKFAPLKRMGDIGMMVKYFSRMAAYQEGLIATYMPKPLHNEAGNGMHFHQHLFKNGKPLFYSKSGYAGLSKIALHYIAGLLHHAPALMAITNPSTNSYKRLVPGFEAPVNSFFSLGNRSAAIRIPKYASSPMAKRMEFRPPDATCNMYLAMAAQLMAGLDGIKKKMDPVKLGFGPYDVNVFEMSDKERSRIKSLPTSLSEALDALKKDHAFLLDGDVFDETMIEDWIALKMKKDVLPLRNRTHPLEVQLYLDC